MVTYTEPGEHVPGMEPKVAPRVVPRVARTFEVIFKEALDAPELIKILNDASKLPWSLKIERFDDPVQPIRVDVLDPDGKLVCHFHQVVGSMVDTNNWENNARFICQMTQIIKLLKENQNGSVS